MKFTLTNAVIDAAPEIPESITGRLALGKFTSRGVEIELDIDGCAEMEQFLEGVRTWLATADLGEALTASRRASLTFAVGKALDQLRHRAGNTLDFVPAGGTKWVCPQCQRWVITFVPLLEDPLCGKHKGGRVRMRSLTQP